MLHPAALAHNRLTACYRHREFSCPHSVDLYEGNSTSRMRERNASNVEVPQDIHKRRLPSRLRMWITVVVLLGAYILLHTMSHGEPVIPHQYLRDLPYVMENWKGLEQQLPEQIVQFVGVSDYTNRI